MENAIFFSEAVCKLNNFNIVTVNEIQKKFV